MSHTVNGVPTSYIWDVAAGLPVILQDSEGNTYVYGLDLISRTDEDGVQTYYFSDGLGSTTTVADASGGVVSEYGYDVFGELRGQSGLPDDVMLFTGEQYDARATPADTPDAGQHRCPSGKRGPGRPRISPTGSGLTNSEEQPGGSCRRPALDAAVGSKRSPRLCAWAGRVSTGRSCGFGSSAVL